MGSLLFRNKPHQNSDDSDMWQAPLPKPRISEILLKRVKVFFVFLLRVIIAGFVAYSGFLLYRFTASRTGFAGKTLWDWLDLLIVPFFLGLIAFWFSRSQQKLENKISEDRLQSDREIAKENQREATLKEYTEKIGQLLLDGKLDVTKTDLNARTLVRAYTLTAIRNLDNKRIVIFLRFLYEANLIVGEKPVIDLADAELTKLDLSHFNFSHINFNNVRLEEINFSRTILENAYFCNARIERCYIDDAKMNSAKLVNANIYSGRAAETFFSNADLTNLTIQNCFMVCAKFDNANLKEADVYSCDLREANFMGADLDHTEFVNCYLDQASFKGAKMKRMSVDGSIVEGTTYFPKNTYPEDTDVRKYDGLSA